ncbi:MAG: UbiA prenyltransferase family protein [Theionarchaea archaeon]|nr:UbiA prenyltransferase family protein [Theionarchaea archaeon]
MEESNGGDPIRGPKGKKTEKTGLEETEPKDEKIEAEKLESIYREYWEHARQCVNERIWFTNIYAIIVAAILVFLGGKGFSQPADFVSAFLLASFGLIASLVTFLMIIAVSLGYDHYIVDITMILYYWDKMEFYRRPGKPVTFRKVHRWFFEITIALFATLLVYYASQKTAFLGVFNEHWGVPVLTFFIVFVIIEVLYQCRWEKYSSQCARFKKALRYDFDGKYRKEWSKWFKDPRCGKKTITAEEIQKKVIEDAVERGILLPREKECCLCGKLDWIFWGIDLIYDAFYRIICCKPRKKEKSRKL